MSAGPAACTLIFAITSLYLLVHVLLHISFQDSRTCGLIKTSSFQDVSRIDPVIMPSSHNMFLQIDSELKLVHWNLLNNQCVSRCAITVNVVKRIRITSCCSRSLTSLISFSARNVTAGFHSQPQSEIGHVGQKPDASDGVKKGMRTNLHRYTWHCIPLDREKQRQEQHL